jgi:hypothetical protein
MKKGFFVLYLNYMTFVKHTMIFMYYNIFFVMKSFNMKIFPKQSFMEEYLSKK